MSICIVCSASAEVSVSEKSGQTSDINTLAKAVGDNGPEWGVEIGLRYARTPFVGRTNSVKDVIPMFYYEGKRFFIRGTEGGAHLWNNDKFGADLLIRYRFFDYPAEFNDILNHNTFDVGLRGYLELSENSRLAVEILIDFYGRVQGVARLQSEVAYNRWRLYPLLEIRGKSSSFNSRYYGLGIEDVDAGIDVRGALKSRLHVWKNLHLEGSIEARRLDSSTRDSSMVVEPMEYMAYIGVGLFEDPGMVSISTLKAKPYIRLSQGRGNDSSLAQIFRGDINKDKADVNMTSIFYGHPLSDTLFGLPIELYLTPGIVHHYSSEAQGAATEFVLGFKIYYTVPLPWRVRLGAAEGVSYIDSFSYYEENSLITDNQKTSRFLNYVDLSLDLNLGDVFRSETIENLWFGYGIHHRSGIGGNSSTFGNVSGGSNFNTLYLQWAVNF